MKTSFKRKILIAFIFFLTGIIRFSLLVVPFRYIAAIMGKEKTDSPAAVSAQSYSKARVIGRAVGSASRHTPWKSECLVQALAAQIVLRIFKIPNTLYLGISKDEYDKLIAHAWIRCGGMIVTGGSGREAFKVVAQYSNNFIEKV